MIKTDLRYLFKKKICLQRQYIGKFRLQTYALDFNCNLRTALHGFYILSLEHDSHILSDNNMVFFCQFNADIVHPPTSPQLDTQYTIDLPHQFDALPRLSYGFRKLDAGNNANIRAESSLMYFTKAWIDCHTMTWGKIILYSAVDHILVLVSKSRDFQTGEHMRNLVVGPNDPTLE